MILVLLNGGASGIDKSVQLSNIFSIFTLEKESLLKIIVLFGIDLQVGCRLKVTSPLMELGPIEGLPSVGVFLRDPSPCLLEFRRQPRKTPNLYFDKRHRALKQAPPVFQF